MAGTLPTTPSFTTLNLRSNNATQTTRTVNGRTISRSRDTQFWSFVASYPPMRRAQVGPLMSFIVSQNGQFERFTAILPGYSTTAGALTSANPITTQSETVAGLSTMTIITPGSGSTNISGALKAGDLIKFQNHTKVYMVKDDVSISSGTATLNFMPGLVDTVPAGNGVDFIDVEMTCRLSNDAQEFTTRVDDLRRYELDVIEDL